MEYLVVAELEIDGNAVEHYSGVTLKQAFNEHHQFTIRLNHDILETSGSLSLSNVQKNIGKSVLIRLQKMHLSNEVAYEFRGIICEIRMEQSGRANTDLVLMGYSPTILIENGQNLSSFYKCDLKKIVQKITKAVSDFNCTVNINNQYKKPVTYICQYKESGFHFLNRLSANFSEFFYYDGQALNFGKPGSAKNIEVAYGEDITSMELSLKISPMNFTNYSYISKEDKVEKYDSPKTVDGLGEYASYVLKESNNVFSEPITLPVRQRIENKSDLENFVKKQKASLAAGLETLTGSGHNPEICIGGIIDVKISRLDNNSFIKEDYGKFLVTRIEHFINENGKYYNTFEAIPSGLEVLPEPNIIAPLAEPQIATVKDNKDPDNMGRVRVQMLWQQGNDMTDWVRVMTPDGGGGKDGGKNRGMVFIPEPGDQVLICFRYNDPDRPFILGSMFHGKTGGGGGEGNKTKSLSTRSGSTVTLDDDAGSVNVADAAGNAVTMDGEGNVTIECSASITLHTGDSQVVLNSDGTIQITGSAISIEGTDITITGDTVSITGNQNARMASGGSSFVADGQADEANMNGTKANVSGASETSVHGGAKTTVSSAGKVALQGAIVALN